jgi:hypothetical protein
LQVNIRPPPAGALTMNLQVCFAVHVKSGQLPEGKNVVGSVHAMLWQFGRSHFWPAVTRTNNSKLAITRPHRIVAS